MAATDVLLSPSPARGAERRTEFSVKGAHCANCMRKIEAAVQQIDGVESARLNLSTARLAVTWRPAAPAGDAVVKALGVLGYEAFPFDPAAGQTQVDEEGRFLLRCLAVAAFASMNVMMFSVPVWAGFGEMGVGTRTAFYWIGALIAIPAALYAGRPFFRSAWTALSHGRANMDVPISLAVLLTLGVSISETLRGGKHAYFDGVVALLFLLLIGRYLDHQLRQRARVAARELLAMQAVQALRLDENGHAAAIAARDIQIRDRLALAPGERAPVNAVVETGSSDVDRAFVTGESAPVLVGPGDVLHAGVINLTSPLTVRATSTTETSLVGDLARLIEQGEQRRDAYVRLADRAAALYVPVVHTLAAATMLGWIFIAGESVRTSLLVAVTVLIITCPCALGLAAPAVQVVATGRLFKRGVYVRSGDALERLAQVDMVMLDKTGTVTLGKPKLVNGDAIAPDALRRAAQLARASRHPFARALADHAGPGPLARQPREVQGAGVEGEVEGASARLGKRAFAGPLGAASGGSESELWFRCGDEAPVRFAFIDAPRSDAAAVIAEFERRGLRPCLISGDHLESVAAVAAALGLRRFEAGLSPTDKVARVEAARASGRKVLMIGDGLNDAAALAAAHASASPGAAVDATQAVADIVFNGEELGRVLEAMDVARAARRRLIENFAFSAVYNVFAIPAAVFGMVTPLIAALAMAGSSLAVTLNALRLARQPREPAPWTR
jgi:Cu2+-exporting ATPase